MSDCFLTIGLCICLISKRDIRINPYLQAGGRRFESDYLHPSKSSTYGNVGAFSFCISRSFVAVSAFYKAFFILLLRVVIYRIRGYKSSQIRYETGHHTLVLEGYATVRLLKVRKNPLGKQDGFVVFSGSRLVIGLREWRRRYS